MHWIANEEVLSIFDRSPLRTINATSAIMLYVVTSVDFFVRICKCPFFLCVPMILSSSNIVIEFDFESVERQVFVAALPPRTKEHPPKTRKALTVSQPSI